MSETIHLSLAEGQRLQLQADILDAAFLEFSKHGYSQKAVIDIVNVYLQLFKT
ncbi:hypothetical protein [Acinetobacter piscicola]|uniref:hypothetical protein n=1 Tax=Acinetobacter piscicola TaxID=2006115 RepID=UPI001D1967E3|nr:hypothetical protein [Acinetobacter piscicola]